MGKEGLLAQLSLALKADFTISGSLHCGSCVQEAAALQADPNRPSVRFIASFNEFNVQSDQETFKEKLNRSKKAFMEIYDSARPQLESMMQCVLSAANRRSSSADGIPFFGAGRTSANFWPRLFRSPRRFPLSTGLMRTTCGRILGIGTWREWSSPSQTSDLRLTSTHSQ